VYLGALFLQGFQPLHFAACNGHLDTVKALVEAGADVATKDNVSVLPCSTGSGIGIHVEVHHRLPLPLIAGWTNCRGMGSWTRESRRLSFPASGVWSLMFLHQASGMSFGGE
jgi:hypothetical protein